VREGFSVGHISVGGIMDAVLPDVASSHAPFNEQKKLSEVFFFSLTVHIKQYNGLNQVSRRNRGHLVYGVRCYFLIYLIKIKLELILRLPNGLV
jgi:hypothetical protein